MPVDFPREANPQIAMGAACDHVGTRATLRPEGPGRRRTDCRMSRFDFWSDIRNVYIRGRRHG